ncbi:hypothetical protein NDU88_003213 [Pleurodeles waltl]|uniref:Uncharacterized protein n=1 Tax=Pleurodeles waltl TaxID=8319 RepID=A0AAV7W2V3_PLEWA|nr:hypothetical protein NDU88_003213 [Pleurodeles waltl]
MQRLEEVVFLDFFWDPRQSWGFGCERGAPVAGCDIGKEAQRGKCMECGLRYRALESASVQSLSDRDVLAFSFIAAGTLDLAPGSSPEWGKKGCLLKTGSLEPCHPSWDQRQGIAWKREVLFPSF